MIFYLFSGPVAFIIVLRNPPTPPPPTFSDPKVFNIATHKPDGADYIFIGRPSIFGNPFTVSEYGRKKAIELFEKHLFSSRLIDQIHLL